MSTRGKIVRAAIASFWAYFVFVTLKADKDPLYTDRVRSTIASAVPSGGLKVLEVGIGGAPNLECYPRGTKLVGLDVFLPPSGKRKVYEERAREAGVSIQWVEGSAEELPFESGAFDAVVITKVLCSVRDPAAALREVSRVLAKGGRLGYVEHVAAPRGSLLEAQQLLLDPAQQKLAGNCHLHRDTDGAIRRSVASLSGGVSSASFPSEPLFAREAAHERFRVWSQWPVAAQAAGVVVK